MATKDVELGGKDVLGGGATSSGSDDHSYHRGNTFGAGGGMTVCIKDLTYSVPSSHEKGKVAVLLNKVTGYAEPGKMTALMGPSGSGKTTLLDLLAGRKTVGKTEGTISFAGHKPTQAFLRRYTGYVEQFDTLLPILTVKEMLMYTAELKRDVKESLKEKHAIVDALLEKLALVPCKDVKIGSSMAKGISGGQAKRVNIGIALVTNPKILFLDEPTSGLDSYTSNEVMTVVRALTSDGVTIVATIHSPTAYTFNLFDRLLMLVRGRTVYFGTQGRPAVEWVRGQCPQMKDMNTGYNDAEWLVDLVTEADRMGKGSVYADTYEKSELARENEAEVLALLEESKRDLPAEVQKQLATTRETVTPWWWGLMVLIKYRTSRNYRDPTFLGSRIGDKLILGLLILTLYLGVGSDFSPENLINIAAVLYMWNVLPAFGASSYVPAIVLERALFVRERSDGLYRVITYLLAKMFDELVLALMTSLVVSAFVFYGLQLQGQWVLFWCTYYITLSTGIMLAYFISALSPNMDVANAALPTYVVTLLFFGGFLFTYDSQPVWWAWYSRIDFIRYGWSAVMVNQFQGQDPQYLGGQTVLQYYGVADVDKWQSVGFLSCFFFFFTILTWVTLKFKRYSSR